MTIEIQVIFNKLYAKFVIIVRYLLNLDIRTFVIIIIGDF